MKKEKEATMFKKAEQTKRWFKVCLFGDYKVGKSRFALSFPGCYVMDSERGTLLFSKEFDFHVAETTHWDELSKALNWIEANPEKYKTVVIDSATPLWADLVQQQTDYVMNRRGNEILSMGDWQVLKKRWRKLLSRLLNLSAHVVLTIREKAEYEQLKDDRGQDVSKKTGEIIPDVEKSTAYLFDVILRLSMKEDKKKKTAQYLATVDGSRINGLPKFKTFDLTKKKGYDAVFKVLESEVMSGKVVKPKQEQEPQAAAAATAQPNGMMMMVDSLEKFAAPKDSPMTTVEDLKVLMTRAGEMVWPNGEPFKSADGKTIIKSLFKVESSKELRKHQVDFLYAQFGKVLTDPPTSRLARDEKGMPFVEPVSKDMSF